MRQITIPFNLDLLITNRSITNLLKQVKALEIFESSTKNFHPEGLFSTEIFGRIGSDERMKTFAYIDLNHDVLHPVIYKTYVSMKKLYGDIMSGKRYAIWDEKINDFVQSTPVDGDTGYTFFLKHMDKISLPVDKKGSREFYVKLLNKYKGKNRFRYFLVLPAGLRDYTVDDNGKPSEDEINTLYRKVLSLSNVVSVSSNDISALDKTLYDLQVAVYEVYDYIRKMLDGKKKFIQGKWASRRIFNGTRNVITSLTIEPSTIDDPRAPGFNDTVVGLYQYVIATKPITIRQVKNEILSKIFRSNNLPATLINKKTLQPENISLDNKTYNEWMSDEGLESLINKFGQEEIRHKPLEIDDHYLALVYVGNDNTFKIVYDPRNIPEDRLKTGSLHPLTFAELLYISIYKIAKKYPCLITRYPVTALGGIYPSRVYLKTTIKSNQYRELDDMWNPTEHIALEYPIDGQKFFNSVSPHFSKLARLGADFDGDTVSFNVLYTEEAIEEIEKKLNSKEFYIGPDGRLVYSANTDTTDYVLSFMTS